MRFSEIPGLEEVKRSLIKSVKEGAIAHAQLFSGIEGGGNLALARAFVSYLFCSNRGEDSCGECASCQKNEKLVHPDVHYVFPVINTKEGKSIDPISKNFINEWRPFLLENPYPVIQDWAAYFGGENKQAMIYRQESREIIKDLSLMSFEGHFKTMIIWLPELMHPSSANGILKILEEPPDKTLFLLVSNQPSQIISTITSRCVTINIRPFFDNEVRQVLESKGIEKNKSAQLAHLANGSLNKALKLDETLESDHQKMFTEWMRVCFEFNLEQMVNWTEDFGRGNKLLQKSLLEYGLNMLRETLVNPYDTSIQLAVESEKEFVGNFSKVIDWEMAESMSQEIEKGLYHIERNANAKILFLDLSLRFATLFRERKRVVKR